MRILEIRESTRPIASNIRNAYIDFSKMTLSLVAVVTDQVRDGRPVIGYGFNSNGRYGQGALMRERFIPRVLGAAPDSLLDERGLLCPHRIWTAMMTNEKPGGHGERSVAVGTIDMALWDAVAKIEGKPLYRLLAERYGDGRPNRRVFVYAAGGYYWPGKGLDGLTQEMRSYLDRYAGVRPDRDWLQFDCALSYGLVEYLRTLAMLDEHGWSRSRCIPHGGHQMSLAIAAGLGLGGNESYPDLFQPYGGFPDGVRVEGGHVTLPELVGIGFEGKTDLRAEMHALAR